MPAMGYNPTFNQPLGSEGDPVCGVESASHAESTRKIEDQGSHQDYADCATSKHGAAKIKASTADQKC